ncbi:MAG: S26 family signal peptidase [Acidimicrobiales bacterium]
MARVLEFFVRRVEVEGTSMTPTYQPGERLTAVRRWRPIHPGDVVVVRDPRDHERWLLKRCVSSVGFQLDLRGDNPSASTDSRDFGLVDGHLVKWIVVSPRPHPSHQEPLVD